MRSLLRSLLREFVVTFGSDRSPGQQPSFSQQLIQFTVKACDSIIALLLQCCADEQNGINAIVRNHMVSPQHFSGVQKFGLKIMP